MRRALFGGTFNPVHLGHLLMAEAARDQLKLDQVLFVPAGQPPHKRKVTTSAQHRLAMLRLAIRNNPAFEVSDWEIQQKRVVYTFETLDHFSSRWPKDKLYFIVGSDSLRDLPLWRQGQALLKRYPFLVIERPEMPWKKLSGSVRKKARRVPCSAVPFASHAIRALVRKKASIRYQVPEAVESYIRSHKLYRRHE